jgi:hypothetical protein
VAELLAEALDLLAELEWPDHRDGDSCCAVCGGLAPVPGLPSSPRPPGQPNNALVGHGPACRLRALLEEARRG